MVLKVDRRARLVALAAGCIVLVVLVAGAIASGASSNERPLRLHLATHVSSGIAKAFPVLRSARASDAAEASQLAVVANAISSIQSAGLKNGHDPTGGANPAFARRIGGSDNSALYLVPGNGTLCHVSIREGRFAGGGCGEASLLEQQGSVGYGIVPGGYEVHGILPAGSGGVQITDANGKTSNVPVTSAGGFVYEAATPPVRLVFNTPAAGEQVRPIELTPPAPTGVSAPQSQG